MTSRYVVMASPPNDLKVCADMRVDMRTDTRLGIGMDMRVDMRTAVCLGVRTSEHKRHACGHVPHTLLDFVAGGS